MPVWRFLFECDAPLVKFLFVFCRYKQMWDCEVYIYVYLLVLEFPCVSNCLLLLTVWVVGHRKWLV